MDKSWKSFIDLIAMLQAGLLCWHRYAPINVKPQGGGGGGRPRGILHFNGSQSQIPYPQAPTNCQFPASGVTFSNRVRT